MWNQDGSLPTALCASPVLVLISLHSIYIIDAFVSIAFSLYLSAKKSAGPCGTTDHETGGMLGASTHANGAIISAQQTVWIPRIRMAMLRENIMPAQ